MHSLIHQNLRTEDNLPGQAGDIGTASLRFSPLTGMLSGPPRRSSGTGNCCPGAKALRGMGGDGIERSPCSSRGPGAVDQAWVAYGVWTGGYPRSPQESGAIPRTPHEDPRSKIARDRSRWCAHSGVASRGCWRSMQSGRAVRGFRWGNSDDPVGRFPKGFSVCVCFC